MIRHLLINSPERLGAFRPGDWVATFEAHKGNINAPALSRCPYIGDVSLWQADPDNAAKILDTISEYLRPKVLDLVQVIRREFFEGAIYFKDLDESEYILAYRSNEVTPELHPQLQAMARMMRETRASCNRRGMAYDPLAGLEGAEVWIGGAA
jgi:hypothetical protein